MGRFVLRAVAAATAAARPSRVVAAAAVAARPSPSVQRAYARVTERALAVSLGTDSALVKGLGSAEASAEV